MPSIPEYGRNIFLHDYDPRDWDVCSIHKWLNKSFYENAFTQKEKAYIIRSEVSFKDQSTKDYVFLLSSEEVQKYLPTDEERILTIPHYAGFPGYSDFLKKKRAGVWYLRTKDQYTETACVVLSDGLVDESGTRYYSELDIRPAIWINVGKASKDTPRISAPPKEKTTGKAKKYKIGDVILLGRYEQDNTTKEKEDISWIIIKKEGNKALLLSRYVLDRVPFFKKNTADKEMTWETSYIRSWLNNSFYREAFNDREKKIIQKSKVVAHINPYSGEKKQGKDTLDHLFLLSAIEERSIMSEPRDEGAQPTEYALTKRLYTDFYHEGNT